MRKTYIVFDFLKEENSFDAGKSLYFVCKQEIAAGNKVSLSLDRVAGISSSFLNGFLLPLLEDFGSTKIKESLSFTNLKSGHVMVLNKYMANLPIME
jgi:hypothetical protein